MIGITAILPAYNKEISIGSVVLRTKQHADRVIVIDDGSTDCTAEVAEMAGAEVIRHHKSLGKGAALKSGFDAAAQNGTKVIVTMDTDGRHDPARIPQIVGPIKNEDYDISAGIWSNSNIPVEKENIFLFNRKKPINNKPMGFLAFSVKSLNKIDLTGINVEDEPDFNLLCLESYKVPDDQCGEGVNMHKEIYELAKEYLIENIGELVSADDVYFDVQQNTWNIKIIAKTPHGILILGEMRFDRNKNIVDVPTKETLLNILRSKLQEERVLIDVPRTELARIKNMISSVRVYG